MTEEGTDPGEATLFPKTVGERLRDARLAQKLDLADIAQRTRVPLRHLQAIEDGDYSGMPTSTYSVGFARAYARAVGEDEVEIAREVRGGSDVSVAARRPQRQPYDIEETRKVPSGGVMIVASLIALLLAIGAAIWFGTTWFRGDGLGEPAPSASFTPGTTAEPAAIPAATTGGQVTLVANDEVWVRIYDANNNTLKMGTLAAGERFDVPGDAIGAMINTGRPDKLQVLVNGTAVAALGTGRVAIKDVPISAAALTARNLPAPSATETAAPAPAPTRASANPSPRATRSVPPYFRDAPATTPTASPPATPEPAAPGNGF